MSSDRFITELESWASRHADAVEGFFGHQSVTWKVNREAAIYLGGLRALLMQIAHPKVAQGVADHSAYKTDPFARLRRTFDIVHAIVFGTRSDALAAARRLHTVHSKVRGFLTDPVEGMSREYTAQDPELLLWVHATLVDSSLHAFRTFFDPLRSSELVAYYEESKVFAKLVGVDPELLPPTTGAFDRYVTDMLSGPELVVTPTARLIADTLLKGPPLLYLFRPGNYVLASGMLPSRLREAYGLSWGLPARMTYRIGVELVRQVTPRLPPTLRYIPSFRRAARRCAARDELAA